MRIKRSEIRKKIEERERIGCPWWGRLAVTQPLFGADKVRFLADPLRGSSTVQHVVHQRPRRCRFNSGPRTWPDSSVVEHPTVNRSVPGSNPGRAVQWSVNDLG